MNLLVVAGLADSWYARVAEVVRPCVLQFVKAEL
jgi:hypothetical protein